ncbi:MAG TPA: hypothetical protein VHM26_07460, partial [Chitinophagaceae bacterium]|nr:hypothetical protein [Chitinophagaceae bacterium]
FRLLSVAIIMMIGIYSCSSGNSEGDITLLKEVNNSLLRSNEATILSTNNITESLKDKTKRPETSERAIKWLSKAEAIRRLTDSIIQDIKRIKSDLIDEAGFDPLKEEKPNSAKQSVQHIFNEHKEGQLLHEKLALYKRNLISIDTHQIFRREITDRITITGTDMINKESSFAHRYFNTTVMGAITMLNKIENDVRITENKLTALCHEQTAFIDNYDHYSYKAIISQNANIVKPGDKMQIFAGIGAFSIKAKPVVLIEGREIPLTENAYARYDFKASSTPGIYRIPVQIKFIDPVFGKEVIVTETVEYKVKSDQ